jgi:hypothetical protein
MKLSTQERIESLLSTIDKLGMVKIKHLLYIHDLKSYRNAARIVSTQLKPYINETFFNREKVIYLNKEGRALIGSLNGPQKPTLILHTLLRNEVYLHYDCPLNWENEYTLEAQLKPRSSLEIHLGGNMKFKESLKVVCDAMFTRNGYVHFIEIDNTRDMIDNRKKIETYAEIIPLIRKDFQESPKVIFFTTTENRKKKLSGWLKGRSINHEVKTFEEIS